VWTIPFDSKELTIRKLIFETWDPQQNETYFYSRLEYIYQMMPELIINT